MMTAVQKVIIILTGGTIDSESYPVHQKPEYTTTLGESLVIKVIAELSNKNHDLPQPEFIRWEKFDDSKRFTEEDMRKIAKFIKESEGDKFIITHGTDAMPQNSRTVQKELKGTRKKVIFTGAYIPLQHGEESDGFNNLKESMKRMAEEEMPKGVHVVADGQLYNPKYLEKDLINNRFIYKYG